MLAVSKGSMAEIGKSILRASAIHRERVATEIVAVKLDQVESVEKHARIVVPVSDAVEGRHPVGTARHRLPVDDAGAGAQPGKRLDDEREAIGQVIAGSAVELHPGYRQTPWCRPMCPLTDRC